MPNKNMIVEISETRTYAAYVQAKDNDDAIEQAKKMLELGILKHTVVDLQCFPEVFNADMAN